MLAGVTGKPLTSAEELPTAAAELVIVEVEIGVTRSSYNSEQADEDFHGPEAHVMKEASWQPTS